MNYGNKSEQELIQAYYQVRKRLVELESYYAQKATKTNDNHRLWGRCDGMKEAQRVLKETFNIESIDS